MLNVLIMAGGSGTRFWPASTEDKPKQFINLISEQTMIQETANRLLPLVDWDHIFICTGEKYKDICLQQLKELPERNIIIEPISRNTAPCILLSTLYINQIFGDSNIIVLPSDHLIADVDEFLDIIRDANMFISKYRKSIISIGVTPNRPETGYGYINYLDDVEIINKHRIKRVNNFVEKPNLKKAEQYLKDGHYLWNAGMFMFNTSFILDEYKQYVTDTYQLLSTLPSIDDSQYENELKNRYCQCESISVDFAIMEKTKHLYVILGDFGWDDIGSWKSLERYVKEDNHNNFIKGNVKLFNSKNNTIFSNDKEVILLDANDLFIIVTNERVIVGNKESLSKVHELRGK